MLRVPQAASQAAATSSSGGDRGVAQFGRRGNLDTHSTLGFPDAHVDDRGRRKLREETASGQQAPPASRYDTERKPFGGALAPGSDAPCTDEAAA
ncbi:unnamed protein product [Lampetra planeri]